MRFLLIGGAGFIGPHVVRHLLDQGHEVAVFHRGKAGANLPDGVLHILGERRDLPAFSARFREVAPDVVIDFILASGRQAQLTMDAVRGVAGRVVALSSGDVYRAAGVLHGTEPGPLQKVPLTEDSGLRTQGQAYRKEVLEGLQQKVPWLDVEYDKIPVEAAILGDRELAGTVVRLAMVYGHGDPFHRVHPYLKRMDDGRAAILIQEDAAEWRGPRGYVENVAAAIALAATSPQAARRIYNIAEVHSFSESEWAAHIGRSIRVGWQSNRAASRLDSTPPEASLQFRAALDYEQRENPDGVGIYRASAGRFCNSENH